jgi:hypothetical protein
MLPSAAFLTKTSGLLVGAMLAQRRLKIREQSVKFDHRHVSYSFQQPSILKTACDIAHVFASMLLNMVDIGTTLSEADLLCKLFISQQL